MPNRIISAFRFALSADARSFNREMRRGERTIDAQERAIRQLSRQVRTANQRFQTFQRSVISMRGALVSVAAIGGFLRLAQEATQAATALVELSDRTGFTTDRLQTLGRVFEGDGVSAEQFSKAINRMNQSINDARNGLSTASRALMQIGVSLDDLEGLSPEDQFDLIADGVGRLADEASRAGVIRDIFGSNVRGFINVLQQGTDFINDQEEAFRRLGLTTEDDLRSLKALNQEFTNISTTLRVSLQQSFSDSSDELRDLLVQLQELIRVGTPFAISGAQIVTGGLTTASNNAETLAGAGAAYFGGRAVAALSTQIGTLATAIGGTGGAATAISTFAARLAAIAGPAGAIAGVVLSLNVFRNEITDFARFIRLLPEEEPGRLGADPRASEIIDELIRLTNIQQRGLPSLRGELEPTPRFQIENREAISEFVRELEIGTENVEAILARFREIPRRNLRLEGEYEARLNDLVAAVSDGLQEIIDDLQGQLETRLAQDRLEALARIVPQTTDVEEIDTGVSEAERIEQERINRQLELRNDRTRAIVEGTVEILAFERESLGLQSQKLQAEDRLVQLLGEREDIERRIAGFEAAGLTTEAQDLEASLAGVNVQISRLQGGLTSFQYRGALITDEQQLNAIEEFGENLERQFGRGGARLFDDENLERANVLFEQINNSLGLFDQLNAQMDDSLRNASFRIETIGDITQEWLTNMREGLAQVIVYTDDWGQALERLGRLALAQLISSVFTEDRLRTLFTGNPGRQFGGRVNPFQPYVVGETGPELFVPATAGEIIPNRETQQRGSVNITFSPVINSTDGPGVRRALNEALPLLRRNILETVNNQNVISVARDRG